METNIEKCITKKVPILVREYAIQDLSTITEVLLLIDGYMSEMPQDTLHAFEGGFMTTAELRGQIHGAIKLARPYYANLIQETIVFSPIGENG